LADVTAAWYQREITIPKEWAGRRIVLVVENLNSMATVYLDGKRTGDVRFPGGELELSSVCQPDKTHVLTLHVVALPIKGVMLSYSDTNAAREVPGRVARRGLCGDAYLVSTPAGPRIADLKVETSVRERRITFDVAVDNAAAEPEYMLAARIADGGQQLAHFQSEPFRAADLRGGHRSFQGMWLPERLWDVHTPQHQYDVTVSILDGSGRALDVDFCRRFGFREFWIDGRDFYLNGTRLFLSAVPLDNSQVGAAWASYAGARESLQRLKTFGINFLNVAPRELCSAYGECGCRVS
jgi:beta-galactosidase/beta-glucuronidase